MAQNVMQIKTIQLVMKTTVQLTMVTQLESLDLYIDASSVTELLIIKNVLY